MSAKRITMTGAEKFWRWLWTPMKLKTALWACLICGVLSFLLIWLR